MNVGRLKPVAMAGVLAIAVVATGFAQPTLVTSRAALGANDFVDWSGFGGTNTTVPSGSNINSNLGGTVTVTNPSGNFERRNQNNGWAGNFAPGDPLLWTQNTVGPMVISFGSPVSGAGAQIQRDSFGGFTATIDVFDAGNNLLASFNLAGSSTSAGDNSAIFLGAVDASPTISRIEYSVDGGTQDFAINQLDIGGQQVPTMSHMGLVLLGLLLASVSVVSLYQRRRT